MCFGYSSFHNLVCAFERLLSGVQVRTGNGYYGGSTVVPVVVPVFWSFVPTRYLTNFLYELKVGQAPYEKPESGRVCGPKGSLQGLLGRLWGRGQERPNDQKKLPFSLFVF